MARPTKAQIAADEALRVEQQAELARLRKQKRLDAKLAKVAAAQPQVVPDKVEFDPIAEDMKRRDRIASAMEELMEGFQVPSWKRAVLAAVTGLLLAAGTGWIIGTLTGMLVVSAIAFTGMAWLGWVILVLGMICAALAGGKIAGVGFSYITDHKVDAHFAAAKNKVTSWFRTPVIAQFTGAHVA